MNKVAKIGESIPRVEGRLKVTGEARYVAEHAVDLYRDLHHGVIVGAKIAAGQITGIDVSEAERVPGVIAIFTYENAPRLNAVEIFPRGPAGEGRPPLQDAAVTYGGQAVALVVAATAEIAQEAAELVQVAYEETPAQTTWALVYGTAQPEQLPGPLAKVFDITRGNVGAALDAAEVKVESIADTPGHSQSAMELSAAVAAPDGAGGLVLHESTHFQLPTSHWIHEGRWGTKFLNR